MHFTPREIDKLLIYMMAQVAQRRKDQGLKLNHPETVSLISVAALMIGLRIRRGGERGPR